MTKVSECKFKMDRLFKKEKGCVSEGERGSFIVDARCFRKTGDWEYTLHVSKVIGHVKTGYYVVDKTYVEKLLGNGFSKENF